MLIYQQDYYGFVYIWFDYKRKKYCIGSHMGSLTDGYTSSTGHFHAAYKKRPHDMKRRILNYITTPDRLVLHALDQHWLDMILDEELGNKYYNIKKAALGLDSNTARRIAEDKVKDGTHPFLGGEHARKAQRALVENGTHRFCDSEYQRARCMEQVEKGTHPFLGGEVARRVSRQRVEDGTNPFLGPSINAKNLAEGRHASQHKTTCPHCGKTGAHYNMKRYHFEKCKQLPPET